LECTFDTLDHGAELSIGDGTLDVSRTGVVTGIPADAQSDPFVMVRALEEIISRAGQSHPALAAAILSRLLIRPAKAGDSVTFAVTYTSPSYLQQQGGNAVRWIVEDETTNAEEVEEVDLNGQPIQTWFRAVGGPFLVIPTFGSPRGKASWLREANIATHTGQAHVKRPRRTLSIHGYIIGRPSEDVLFAQDTVNEKSWSGLKRGYWLCGQVSAAVEGIGLLLDHQTSTTRVSARFESKLRRDWSHYFLHRNLAGKIPSEMTGPDYAAAIKEVMGFPYSTEQNHAVNGFTKVGMYHLTDFYSVFGF
jgi:hypothetical protein